MSVELSSQGIAQIVSQVISQYDLHDEDGNELTDDLYVIRSERLNDLAFEVAKRIHKATHELESQDMPVHSMIYGSVPPNITTSDDGTYTLRFDNSNEAFVVEHLNKTALTDIKKTVNEFLKEVKNREQHK